MPLLENCDIFPPKCCNEHSHFQNDILSSSWLAAPVPFSPSIANIIGSQ